MMQSTLAYDSRNALNAICPYFTMFPLEYPFRVLRSHRSRQPIVLDPFCGRGTTLFAARKLGLPSRGIDTSPVAVAIARAKLCKVDVGQTVRLAERFLNEDHGYEIPQSEFYSKAFTPSVLSQICAIRAGLLRLRRDSDASVLLRAAMLGCLHGPRSKRPENQSYFSNQMPRTFATKPDYSIKYWRVHCMTPQDVDVIKVIQRKLSRIQEATTIDGASIYDVRCADAQNASSLPQDQRDHSIVVTSPPYYGMRTYVEDQWLRNWFIGGPDHVHYGQSTQLHHTGQDVFAESLGKVWKNVAHTSADEFRMFVRFGVLPSTKVSPLQLFRNSLESSGVSWRIISIRTALSASSGKRQAKQMASGSDAAIEYDFHLLRQ